MEFAGKYEIVKKLDAGGMAEVYVAKSLGAAGITKTVAIKRVLPHLSSNEKFIRMFLDEARVGMKLSHANIVQVFDVGEAQGSYYIVMEFVKGVSLRKVLDVSAQHYRVVPVATAVHVAAETARGLGYAHRATDEDGHPLRIVHRDVSPPNILLSDQGEVKISDFGLAKAASQLERTDPGVVKGKFSYLAPEAIDGLEVDHRADIFSLGVVLFEMLTGRRLFLGKTDYQTVQLVSRCHVPPIGLLNPQVPTLLADIVQKALVRDRDHRYQSAEEFAEALTSFLYAASLKATSKQVADLVAEASGKKRRRATVKLAQDFVREELLRSLSDPSAPVGPSPAPDRSDSVDTRNWIDDLGLDDMADQSHQDAAHRPPPLPGTPKTPPPPPEPSASGFFRKFFKK